MLAISLVLLLPSQTAHAGVMSFIGSIFSSKQADARINTKSNSQNMTLLQATVSPDPNYARGGGDITIVGDSALLPDSGPSGTQADMGNEFPNNGQISVYVVHPEDSLGSISKMFGVSVSTIVWANDIKSSVITPGQKLIILPVSGIQHTIKAGDTIKSVANKYKSDVGEILAFNLLSEDSELKVGDTIIIPEGEIAPVSLTTSSTRVIGSQGVPSYSGYYLRPLRLSEGYKTQGLHGYNGVDIGAPLGTPAMASADGEVIISRSSGWNGGYGKYVVIRHGNGTQTLYGHLNAILVPEGTYVAQGQFIGYVGSTGRSTGPHLHFEIRGAKNPF